MGYKIHFLGWCNEPAKNHDKIWGWIQMDSGAHYNFWGRRGATLTFERHPQDWNGDNWDLRIRARQKAEKKGYENMPESRYGEVHDDLINYIETQFVLAKFSGKVRKDYDENDSFI